MRISYLDERDQPRDATIIRERLKGEMSQRLAIFPRNTPSLRQTTGRR